MDTKRFYKKADKGKFPSRFAIGTVIADPTEFFSGEALLLLTVLFLSASGDYCSSIMLVAWCTLLLAYAQKYLSKQLSTNVVIAGIMIADGLAKRI